MAASHPVIIFGAGATKACGGPLTAEILPDAFRMRTEIEREGYLELVDEFLSRVFHVPAEIERRHNDDYPALPLLLALLDTAIDKKHSFGPDWSLERLVHVRDGVDYLIFALLENRLRRISRNFYHDLLKVAWQSGAGEPDVISLNYDIIADNTMCWLIERFGNPGFPDYGADISSERYQHSEKHGRLLKLHGSLNWLYCPACHRLDLGVSKTGRGTSKVLEELYIQNPLEDRYGCHGSECPECRSSVRPVLITPTHLKDYRNPHISRVWYEAERTLRRADRAFIIGYSLPEDDVDVTYLLKRGLQNVPAARITVIEYDPGRRPLKEHPVGRRYRSLFGDDLDWRTEGFGAWAGGFSKPGAPPLLD